MSMSDPDFHADDNNIVPASISIEDTVMDIEQLSMASQGFGQTDDTCHSQEVEEKGQLDVNVRKVNIARSNSALKAGVPCYEMTAKPRGQALIIEIDKYINDVQEQRIGSHHDVANLTKLLDSLGFEVTVKKNLDKRDFDNELMGFSKNSNHKSSNMMILVVLSHGKEGHVFASDGRVIETEKIYEKFNNQSCPFLKGKPKFFIIQACRGDDTDKGSCHEFPVDWEASGMNQRKRRYGTDYDTIPFNDFDVVNKARPTWEDMIIAYSTIPGFASIRDHDKGTWFIQSLVEVFSNHAHDKELIDLLRMTSERLSQFTNEKGEKQTCNIEMRHLYKRIYFNPGYFEEKTKKVSVDEPAKLRKSLTSPRALRRSKSNPPHSPRRTSRSSFYDEEEEED